MKLHGQVRWVGVTPPTSTPTPTLSLPHPAPTPSPCTSTHTPTPSDQSTTPTSVSRNNAPARENASSARIVTVKSLSEDNRGIYEGAGELHPWENNIDPDIARIDYEEDLQPLYVKVQSHNLSFIFYCIFVGRFLISPVFKAESEIHNELAVLLVKKAS